MANPKTLDDLKPAAYNPRQIDEHSFEGLKMSVETFGDIAGIVFNTQTGNLVCGHQRVQALREAGGQLSGVKSPVIKMPSGELFPVRLVDWDLPTERLANVAANNPHTQGDFDQAKLQEMLIEMEETAGEAFEGLNLDQLVQELEDAVGEVEEDEAPEPPAEPQTKTGDLWMLGDHHKLLCGDSTIVTDVEKLMGGKKSCLIHADPPYGMGKENEGVENDNIYGENLDAFQMEWWLTCRPFLEDNASAYIWGNPESLWRLWYGSLKDSERLTLRSQIIWDKPPSASSYGSPIGSEKMRSYPHGYEACLFFMLGEQGFNNNADNYWEGWEPIRSYLDGEMKRAGWTTADLNRITGTGMAGHWVTKSQWGLITEQHYKAIQEAASGDAFKREHDELKREHDELKREHDELKRAFYETRAYFDNTHDNMTDVWEFNRVTGTDRHGHATPKPVEMIARCLKSSSPAGAIVLEPFLGSGSTLISAEQTKRICYGIEIAPKYCDVICQRYYNLTGVVPVLEDGTEFRIG